MPRPNSTDPKDLTCPICKKQLSTRQCLNNHVQVVHMNAGRFKCDWCPKTLRTKAYLTTHQMVHTGEKPLRCQVCKKPFRTKSQVNLHHQNVHSEKKFKCHTCSASFGSEAILRMHRVIHSNDRPFKCGQCGFAFKHPHNLKRHISRCSIARPRASTDRRFAQKENPVLVGEVKRSGGRNGLRTIGKQPNYRVDSQDVDDESGESSKSGSSGNSRVSNEPVECEGLLYEEQNGDQDPETIIISSDEMSDQEDEMAGEWSTGAGAKLKMVFDVEYVAPE